MSQKAIKSNILQIKEFESEKTRYDVMGQPFLKINGSELVFNFGYYQN